MASVLVGILAISARRKLPGDTVATQIGMAIGALVLGCLASLYVFVLLGWALGIK